LKYGFLIIGFSEKIEIVFKSQWSLAAIYPIRNQQ